MFLPRGPETVHTLMEIQGINYAHGKFSFRIGVWANGGCRYFAAVVRLMKPKPYETPPAPVHREGFTTSQLILIGAFLRFEGRNTEKHTRTDRAESEQNCSLPSTAFI